MLGLAGLLEPRFPHQHGDLLAEIACQVLVAMLESRHHAVGSVRLPRRSRLGGADHRG